MYKEETAMVKAIVGANWGDEGKGKITDMCAGESDIVVRFQGGSNAGHTIINEHGKFALHLLPSGIFHENTLNIIGNGVALNIEYLLKEVDALKDAGIKFQLLISERAQVLLKHHVLLDEYEEERLAERKFGSTKSGIAPFYADKYSKTGIQVWELYHIEVYDNLVKYAALIKGYVTDTGKILRNAIKENKNILLEGQLGSLKDTDHGIYPYVTSSSTLAGYAAVGAGIPPHSIKDVMVITKAYSSAVGAGPFVSELFGEEADELRKRGGDAGEFGATTGRPRRVGYFDAVATRYGCEIQGATEVVMTCLDVLSYMDKLYICTGYDINGEIVKDFPTTELLYKAKPVYTVLDGWKSDITGIDSYSNLPDKAKEYVDFIEKEINVKISMVSNGPKREEILKR